MESETSVFLFEYATCTAQALPPSVAVEGRGMFKSLYEGFSNPSTFYHAADYLSAFKKLLRKADYVLAIAPETDMELYNLAKLIEESNCSNLGCDAGSIKIASDKFSTYKKLRNLSPKTEVYNGNGTSLDFPLISKPRDGVSCQGLRLIQDEKELSQLPEGILIQEYVDGRSMSASVLVGEEVRILSINTQEIIDFEYVGAKMPLPLADHENILAAVERIDGLFGFVGVDFLLADDEVIIIEVNPRPTTPIMGLKAAFNMNISEIIIKNYYKERIPEFRAVKTVELKKTRSKNGFVRCGNYSIVIEELNEDIGA